VCACYVVISTICCHVLKKGVLILAMLFELEKGVLISIVLP
jgi:hypothetical protein